MQKIKTETLQDERLNSAPADVEKGSLPFIRRTKTAMMLTQTNAMNNTKSAFNI